MKNYSRNPFGFSRWEKCRSRCLAILTGMLLASLAGCKQDPPVTTLESLITNLPPPAVESTNPPAAPTSAVPFYGYEVVNTYPHDRGAFTQGLVFLKGELLESTGLNGQSSLRRVDLKTGRVLQKVEVPAEYFAEGLAVLGSRAFQLTWQNQKGFVYDLATLQKEKEFTYDGEGWGLATDGQSLILSDGTDQIRFLDPDTFQVTRSIHVRYQDRAVAQLNELEWVKGEIYANVWQTDQVVRIDPATGTVVGVIDFAGLLRPEDRAPDTDVLNGIAYDPATDRLFVTGKKWPKLFEVRLIPK